MAQRGAALGQALPASNLASLYLDPEAGPVDVIEGMAWCYAAVELAPIGDDQDAYRAECADYAADLSEDEINNALARTRALLAPQ